jgi:hypothetical protein
MSEHISNSITLDVTLDRIRSQALHSSTPSFQVGYSSLGSPFTRPETSPPKCVYLLFSVWFAGYHRFQSTPQQFS